MQETGMLGNNKALREFWNGPLLTLMERINGENGEEELECFNRYLRKENPWPEAAVAKPKTRRSSRRVDLDADPHIPKGWKVVEHQKGGRWQFDPKKIELYLSASQQGGRTIQGNHLREELKGKTVLNANVLDWLLKEENLHLIPEEWKGKFVFFWGTIYQDADGDRLVRYLYWLGRQWHWGYDWLDLHWRGNDPAALSAS